MMSVIPKRYSIYFADLDPTEGAEMNKTRPVVVISQDIMNRYGRMIVICPLTSSLHSDWRSRLQVTCTGKTAEVAVDQIRAISKHRLKQKIDSLTQEEAAQLRGLITEMYGE